jgi:hypothetical protein
MNRVKVTLLAAISIALAFTFFACSVDSGTSGPSDGGLSSSVGQQENQVLCQLAAGSCSQISLSSCMELVNAGAAQIVSSCQEPSSSSSLTMPLSSSVALNSSSSISVNQVTFIAEIGTVCVGFANLFSKPLDDQYFVADGTTWYIEMYNICGNKSESYITGTGAEVTSWLNLRNISTAIFNRINEELFIKKNSAFLGFYPAVDGYVRYLYIEEVNDGKGLAKSLAKEEK